MRKLTLLLSLLLVLLIGCEQSPQQASQPDSGPKTILTETLPSDTGIFHQPTAPHRMELPNEALAYWRTEATTKPALVIFSFDPFLKPVDTSLRQQAKELALTGSADQLRRHGSYNTAEPLILPNQTVAAAIDAGLIGKIYWIFPSKVGVEQLDLVTFRNQMLEQQILTKEEVASISSNNGIFAGQVRGIPLEAIHYQKLYDIPEPLILHFDMSFFRGLYDNEIKTPLYTQLRDTADSIRAHNWQPLATTLSYSTIEGAVALNVRFVVSNLAELMENPQMLDDNMPEAWRLRSEALYAADMYSESKKRELSQQIVEVAPDSADAHYDRFQVLFLSKKLEPALLALQQAVKLDPGYAAAYLQLAQMAVTDGNTAMALKMLTQAEDQFPEYPFIPLQKAHLMTAQEQYAEAEEILSRLPQQWSTVYHQNIPTVIADLRQQILAGATEAEQKD